MRHAILALLSVAVLGFSMAGFQQSGGQQTTDPVSESPLFVAYAVAGAGYIDASGKWVIPPAYDSGNEFSSGRAVVYKDDHYLMIDRAGKTIFEFPASYDWIGNFKDGLAPAYDGEKLGYIGLNGQVVIDFEYDWIENEYVTGEFNSGVAVVEKDGKTGAINRFGRVVIPIEFDYIWDFTDGAALAKKGDEEGAINTLGRFIFQDSEEAYILDSYHNGLAPATVADFVGFGYIDKLGKWVVQPEYESVGLFDGVYAAVVMNGLIGFIDREGAMVIEPSFPLPEDYEQRFTGRFETEDSLCWVPLDDEHFGYINKAGEVVISGDFVFADDFRNGLALVVTDLHIGYIDVSGEWVYQVLLSELYPDGVLSAFGF